MPRNRGRQSVAGLLPGCLSTLFLLAGCSTTAPIPDAFPDPVVSPIQMSVGVRYTDDFRSYTIAFHHCCFFTQNCKFLRCLLFNSTLNLK